MELLINFDRAIIIDALLKPEGGQPGCFYRLSLNDLRVLSPTQHSASAHDTTLITALDIGERLGLALPEEIIIFAIEVENILEFSEQPTHAVAEAIPKVTEAILSEITRDPVAKVKPVIPT